MRNTFKRTIMYLQYTIFIETFLVNNKESLAFFDMEITSTESENIVSPIKYV